ncbi:MAG TPA: amino acid adenylation domain-containing protein, partial [Thermoanaerobaculia bacterium]|nr:amino acid adenylation domain-containing protein [Thermoanaerobaculia bacterium]
MPIPASFAQQRLWFLHYLEPASPAYNVALPMRLTGALDVAALAKSLNEIVRRHESLRTSFAVHEGLPVQVISPVLTVAIPETDLSELPAEAREREASRLIKIEGTRPFDIASGPLIRATLLRLSEESHVLIVTMHHIVTDGWSNDIFLGELTALYAAFRAGEPSPLIDIPIQYADYAVWQRNWLRGEVLKTQLDYWKKQLTGAPALLELPTDRPRGAIQSYQGASVSAVLAPELLQGLNALARREAASLFMVLLAAFQALLSRYSGQDDVPVGSPTAGRTQVETEGLIGFFVNTLVLRGDVSGDPTFRQLLGRVRETALEAYAHQDLPFEKIVEELQPERTLSHSPLFQVLFQLDSVRPNDAPLPELKMYLHPLDWAVAKFDLSLRMVARRGSLECWIEFNTDLFTEERIRRLVEHWQTLLSGIVKDPDLPVSQLPLAGEAERRRVLFEWNASDLPYPREKTLPGLIEEQAAKTPEVVALAFRGERLTYRELSERANRLARYLRKRGVGPEVLVGLCVERSMEMVVGILGILKAGGAYVPLDPHYPKERLAFMLKDSEASVVVTQASRVGTSLEGSFERVSLDADWPAIAEESGANLAPAARPANLAYVIYTSGSTGRPKGVAIEHRSAVAFVHWAHEVFGPEDLAGVLASTSICFDLSVFEIFVPLSRGGTVLLADNALQLKNLPDAEKVTLINTVPSVMAELLRLGRLPASVRTVNLAGEPLPTRLVKQTHEEGSVRRVFDLYGPSESTTYSTFALRSVTDAETIGRPIANTLVYLLDRRGEPVPIGLPGELYIGGEGMARGYLRRPDLTAERFVPNPFGNVAGTRLYQTGDLARLRPDGNIEFLGRSDRQVKVRGFRIELEEIESVLTEHPNVGDAVVLVREDVPGDKRVVAYVVAGDGVQPAPSELRRFLARKLPEHMVPAAVVALRALPMTPNGKVDRRALPAPEQPESGPQKSHAPQDALELQLVRIWEKVLNVRPVGRMSNFFDLGGHSLLAVRLFSE